MDLKLNEFEDFKYEDFLECINVIREELNCAYNNSFSIKLSGDDFYGNSANMIIKLLEAIMHDCNGIIKYFIFDTNFGEYNNVVTINEKEVVLEDVLDLWMFLKQRC